MKLNKKGFTLVELLAVIVILALLMVVATRTIGTTMTSSRVSAIQTEAKKLFSKTYEEAQTLKLLGEVNGASTTNGYSYLGTGSVTSGTGSLKGTEGDYTYKITLSDYVITGICVEETAQNKGYNSTGVKGTSGASTANAGESVISGASLEFNASWGTVDCS